MTTISLAGPDTAPPEPSMGWRDNTAYYFVVRAFVATLDSADPNEVKFTNGASLPIWIEAEDGDLQWPMVIGDDAAASAGGYVEVPDGIGSVFNPSNSDGVAEYQFEVPETGNYILLGRQISNDSTSDSFFVSADGRVEMVWHTRHGGQDLWDWDVLSRRAEDDPRYASNPLLCWLKAGSHTLTIKQREDGNRLDAIVIINVLSIGNYDLSKYISH